MHDEGLEHQSVRPGNVVLGDDGFARIIDYGRCRPHDCSHKKNCEELVTLRHNLGLFPWDFN